MNFSPVRVPPILFLLFACLVVSPSASDALLPVHGSGADQQLFDFYFLMPGDARSVNFEFDNIVANRGSTYLAVVAALSPDQEVHQLRIDITPVGDAGAEIRYATFGIFISLGVNNISMPFFEVLPLKLSYAFEDVSYTVDVNPDISVGFVVTAAVAKQPESDFPVDMAMTLTLSD